MEANPAAAIAALNKRYFLDYPREAALAIEEMPVREAVEVLQIHPLYVTLAIWQYLSGDSMEALFNALPQENAAELLTELDPQLSAKILGRLDKDDRERFLSAVDPRIAKELNQVMEYPADSAGRLMDTRVLTFHEEMSVSQAENRLRAYKPKALRELFLTDQHGKVIGRVELRDLAIADADQSLASIMRPLITSVPDIAPREEVVEKLEQYKLVSIPVVDFNGRLSGVIRQDKLVTALQEEASVGIQTMVGVSKDESALSPVWFSVSKRLPWLQINLLTAFLAASVVGLFESTIAKFTALAVLLPVVAGQSGNAGAQALAVTMRGLALREISLRHWPKVVFKEVNAGFLNGLAVALTTSIGVAIWSGSFGLTLVIAMSMVIAMVAAGFSGAIIPITLRRLGQDPAQSSSIILTTVTDVVGFFSFLGIATLLSGML
jgi:magnesium transporter